MSEPSPCPDNATAWRQLRLSLEADPGDKGPGSWQGMALSFLSDLEGFSLPTLLRAVRSADRLVFSLAETAALPDAPRVTLTFLPEDQTAQVAYSRGDMAVKAPLIEAWVAAPTAMQVTLGALRRLWTESRPDAPMPEEWQERKPAAQG